MERPPWLFILMLSFAIPVMFVEGFLNSAGVAVALILSNYIGYLDGICQNLNSNKEK